MEKEPVKQMSVPTRFALYVVVIVMLAMGVMEGLVFQSQSFLLVLMFHPKNSADASCHDAN